MDPGEAFLPSLLLNSSMVAFLSLSPSWRMRCHPAPVEEGHYLVFVSILSISPPDLHWLFLLVSMASSSLINVLQVLPKW